MTAKELYDHVTKHMSAEEALLKLMEGSIKTYEHLKFNEGEELHPIMVIAAATLDMGWDIAISDDDPDAELQGMIVGTDDYINKLLDCKTSDDQNIERGAPFDEDLSNDSSPMNTFGTDANVVIRADVRINSFF